MAYSSYQPKPTRNGHNMYDMSSFLQKSIRRGNVKHAAYAAMELFGNYNAYLWRRLIIISAEDCYGIITKEIVALQQAENFVSGSKKGYDRDAIFVAKAVTLLCLAKKNRDGCYVACNFMNPKNALAPEEIEHADVDEINRLVIEEKDIPDYVYDVHTRKGKAKGKTVLDMISDEQNALEPAQLSLFDNGDWEQFKQQNCNNVSPHEKNRWNKFQENKDRF